MSIRPATVAPPRVAMPSGGFDVQRVREDFPILNREVHGQPLCEQTGAVLRVVPVSDDGEFLLDAYENLLSERTRLVAVVHVSNSLGTIVPVRPVIELAHARGALVLIDGAQSAPHMPIDVQ